MSNQYDSIVVGSGCAGAVIARELASRNRKVLVIEERNHIAGNCYDEYDENGILIHKYGPHIFHTNSERVYSYLSEYTEWYDYRHEVVGNVYGKIIPIPFNLNTLELVYGAEKAKVLKDKLVSIYGMESRVPILELMNKEDEDIKDIAKYVYENIFLKYTMKQWGQTPEEIDPSVTSRVPVLISYDNRYFQDKYQGMPKEGYTKLFENLLNHENITVQLNTKAKSVIELNEVENTIYYNGKPFEGEVIYTGQADELFNCRFGRLPYRSLRFEFENYKKDTYQTHGVVNYTVSEDYTRITEFKYLTNQKRKESTTIMKEYPLNYTAEEGQIPYYAIMNEDNLALYNNYLGIAKKFKNFHFVGRLAEYKYYNIDAIVLRALELADALV